MQEFFEFLSADLKLQANEERFQKHRKNMEILKETLQWFNWSMSLYYFCPTAPIK